MEHYRLQTDEAVLFKCEAANGIEIVLTNNNLVISRTKKRLLDEVLVAVDVYPKEDIKIYNSLPQIKQKDCFVTIYFLTSERNITFKTKSDAHKFIKTAFELLTGKTSSQRNAEKVKNAIELVDYTLGISTVGTVKNIVENTVSGSIAGGVSKKIGESTKTSKALKETAQIAKNILTTCVEPRSPSKKSLPISDQSVDKLKKLKELLDQGILTQEEFDKQKQIILLQMRQS